MQGQKLITNWQIVKLGELADFINGKVFKSIEWAKSGLPIIRIQNLNGSKEFNFFDGKYEPKYIVNNGDLLFSWSGNRGTSFGPYLWKDKKGLLNQHIFRVEPKTKVLKVFLFYLLDIFTNKIEHEAHGGSGLVHITKSELQKFVVKLPPLKEQAKIVSILSKVDEEIEKVDQIINKTEKFKKGLLQTLLTKGIDHSKFKKTELGMIPKEWKIVSIKESDIEFVDGDRGINYPKLDEFSKSGYCLFLSNKNIKNDRFIFNECTFITKDKDELLRKGKLERNDIILTTRGTVGTVAIYDNSVPFDNIRINSGMLIFRTKQKFYSDFLYFMLKSQFMKKKYKSVASGSAQPQLPIKSLEKIKIAMPSIKEQKEISKIAISADHQISVGKQIKYKLIQLKQGLMQDLLSGKVRVNN